MKELFKKGQLVRVHLGSDLARQAPSKRFWARVPGPAPPAAGAPQHLLGILVERWTRRRSRCQTRWWKVYVPLYGKTYAIRTLSIEVLEGSE